MFDRTAENSPDPNVSDNPARLTHSSHQALSRRQMILIGRGFSAGKLPRRPMAAEAPIFYPRRNPGDPHGLPSPSELTSPVGITADPTSQSDINPQI